MTKKDLTQLCRETNETHQSVSEQEFRTLWCKRCRNQECRHSQWGKGVWLDRMSTQVDRLLENPQFGNPNDPAFGFLQGFDFEDMKRQAIAIHISEQNNDWEIPSEKDISDFNKDGLSEELLSNLRENEISHALEQEVEENVEDRESETKVQENLNLNSEPLVKTPPNVPAVTNTKINDEGIMLGSPIEETTPIDAWDVPVSKDRIIPVGGKIVLGGKKK